MVKGLYTAATGLKHQQQRMDVLSNNLANVNTTGFKKDGVVVESFEEVLNMKINDAPNPNTSIGNMALGVRSGQVYTNFEQGSFIETGDPLSLAIQGEGFFTVGTMDEEGNIINRYSRDGAFVVSEEGQLMTKDDYYVIGEDGPIVLEQGTVRIDEQGNVYSNDVLVDQLSMVNFAQDDMTKFGDNLYETIEDAEALPFDGQVIQGFLEGSNVNTIKEMVDMITVMRSFEASQKVIQTQDDTLGKAVNDIARL